MYYFIVNPASCSGKGRTIWSQIKKELARRHIPYQCAFTKKQGDASRIAASFSSLLSPCTIVAVGGDGTANEVINGIQHPDDVLFGYIPTGSSNDLARGLGLPSNPMRALSCVLDPQKSIRMDLGLISDKSHQKRFAVSTGIGFDAGICHESFSSPVKPILNRLHIGKLSYAAIAIHQLFLLKMTPMELRLDDGEPIYFQQAYMAAVMNHSCEGGGVHFCPAASCRDGVFDLCIVEGVPRLPAALILLTAFWGKHIHFPHVHIFRCRTAKIRTKALLPVHTDGEIFGVCDQIQVSVAKQKLSVITQ